MNTPPSDQESNISKPQRVVYVDLNANKNLMKAQEPVECSCSEQQKDSCRDDVPTFFSLMDHSFCDLELPNTEIAIHGFLLCCQAILPVLDVLGSNAFAPMKMDIQGNIDKLEKHRKATKCKFVQDLIRSELELKTTSATGSATDALLWLKRALAFICSFLSLACNDGEIDLVQCASEAYAQTLKRHHNFVVRGIFSVALRVLPCYSTFVRVLAPSVEVANDPAYEAALKRHSLEYTAKLQNIVTIIDTFYAANGLVSP